jgi:hypothetical protein
MHNTLRGMLANPDIELNAAIDRWIAATYFKLIHIPAEKLQGPSVAA